MKTKDSIIAMAIQLFNEKGTAAVSTNHIAGAMGISPGNLYYHYRSKEDIIRAIFERVFACWDVSFALPANILPTMDDLLRLFQANFNIMWEYRFIYRELQALLERDAKLKERYLAIRRRGFKGFQQLFKAFSAAGIFSSKVTPQSVNSLAEIIWLISEFWLSSLEINGKPINPQTLKQGVTIMKQVIRPYLTKAD